MRSIDHCNVISLKHCFFSTTSRDELFLNLVMEFVPESLYRVLKHYKDMKQRMPLIYVKLYMYQVGSGRIAFYLDIHVLEEVFNIFTFFISCADIPGTSLYSYCTRNLSPRY